MRRFLALLTALLLALPAAAGADGAQTIACPEEGFSLQCDAAFTSEYVEGDGLYVYTRAKGYIPYVLLSVDFSDTRVRDGERYLRDKLSAQYEEGFAANGPYTLIRHGDYTVAGRRVAAMSAEYRNSQGVKIYLLVALDVYDDYTVYYRVRYADPKDRQQTLDALDQIAAGLRPDAAPSAQPLSLAVTEIRQAGMTVGRCTAPADWKASGQAVCGTTAQSIESPWQLNILTSGPDGSTMAYTSARNFLEILRWDGGTGHQDGVYNAWFHIPMLYYKNAPAYCDYLAALMTGEASPKLVEENTFPEAKALLARRCEENRAKANELGSLSGVSVDAVEATVCMRRYATQVAGVPSYLCFMTGVEAVQSTARVPGIYADLVVQTVSWKVPFVYSILCPAEKWEEYRPVFDQFVENTGASDQFNAANARLSTELLRILSGQSDPSAGIDRCEDVLREETAGGEDYTDRYSDYLFDQNDYTLSDGRHVKVSAAYDYVYQGDDGNVYYSDSAFSQPGGSTRLSPNR